MKSKLLIIFLSVLLIGCVVPRKYSRAKEKVDRIINKFPEILQNDTIIVLDSVFVPEVVFDTIAQLKESDTLFIEKERLTVRIVRLPGDTVQVFAECKSDTIIKNVFVPVYSVEDHNLKDRTFLGLSYLVWFLILLILILSFIVWLKKFK
jgi:hypothetical protein